MVLVKSEIITFSQIMLIIVIIINCKQIKTTSKKEVSSVFINSYPVYLFERQDKICVVNDIRAAVEQRLLYCLKKKN